MRWIYWKQGKHTFDSAPLTMSYPLDFNLRRVAKLRQVTIKTARDWRDSENWKWFKALEEIKEKRGSEGDDLSELGGGRSFWNDLAILENSPVINLPADASPREVTYPSESKLAQNLGASEPVT